MSDGDDVVGAGRKWGFPKQFSPPRLFQSDAAAAKSGTEHRSVSPVRVDAPSPKEDRCCPSSTATVVTVGGTHRQLERRLLYHWMLWCCRRGFCRKPFPKPPMAFPKPPMALTAASGVWSCSAAAESTLRANCEKHAFSVSTIPPVGYVSAVGVVAPLKALPKASNGAVRGDGGGAVRLGSAFQRR